MKSSNIVYICGLFTVVEEFCDGRGDAQSKHDNPIGSLKFSFDSPLAFKIYVVGGGMGVVGGGGGVVVRILCFIII